MSKKIIAFKGFDKDFKCRDFQFEVGKTYTHEGSVKVCQSGFHACEYPLDVWNFYNLGELNRFGVVELSGQNDKEGTKTAASVITVKAELSIAELIKASIDWHFNGWVKKKKPNDKDDSKLAASGYGSNLAASGYGSNLAASGGGSKLAASGDDSNLAASGNYSNLAASGDDSKLAASGYGSKLAASGGGSNLAASGNYSNLAASGDDSKLAASGYGSKLAASGGGSNVIVSAEKDIMVKGSMGTLICLTHYVDRKPSNFVTGKIGENGLKADTWYKLDDAGQFVECEG